MANVGIVIVIVLLVITTARSCHGWMAQLKPSLTSTTMGPSRIVRLFGQPPMSRNVLLTSTVSNVEDDETIAEAARSFNANGVFDTSAQPNGLLQMHQDEEDNAQQNDNNDLSLLGEPLHETMEYGLRFAGVARLYAKELEAAEPVVTATTDEVVDEDGESCPIMESDAAQTVMERLSQATVVIVGLGGVGSWAAEALCRSGVGHLVLIDLDDICISNTNRQVHSMSSTVGHMKIDEMKKRLQDIHPYCQLTLIYDFVSSDNVHQILTSIQNKTTASMGNCNSLVCLDAMDAVPDKVALISACADLKIPIVTCGGAAELLDPTRIRTADLSKVTEDSLLRACRKMLRQENGFQRGLPFHLRKKFERAQQEKLQQAAAEDLNSDNNLQAKDGSDEEEDNVKYRTWNIDAIYSTEVLPSSDKSAKDDESAFRRCDCAAGTACFVTGTFGFVAAGRIVDMIAHQRFPVPRRR